MLSGLRWRFTAWVAVVMLLAAAVTFLAIYRGTGSSLRSQVRSEERAVAAAFARHVEPLAGGSPPALRAAAAAFVRAEPFGATSRLLFLAVPGTAPVTNEPELLGLGGPDDGESVATQASENGLAHALLAAPVGFSHVEVSDVGDLSLLKRPVRAGASTVAVIGVGEPLQGVERAQHSVARTFVLAGGLALLLALLASYLVGARVTRPLRRMAAIAARVEGGDLTPRIGARGSRDEVQILAEAFDRMLDRLDEAFARQRAFVADASHELRTPLTVIRGQIEVLARSAAPDPAEIQRVALLVSAEVARMGRMVDALLILARSDEHGPRPPEELDLVPFLTELWDGVVATAERRYELGEVPVGRLSADPDGLAQALRNLLVNAIEHTAEGGGRVRLSATALAGGSIAFAVEDDGPGISPAERERVFDRFHRSDLARPDSASGGAGLGLAIVRAVAERHGGAVRAERSPLGGARMVVELPGFVAGPLPAGPRPAASSLSGA